jgi:hypothetical protein
MKASEVMKKINVQVNPYLEFINSILLTSRYNEITKTFIGYGLMVEDENKYTIAIKNFFKPYANNPIYTKIEELIPNGFTFSRPVELMLSLGNSSDFSRQYLLTELCIQYCGGIDTIDDLLKQLKTFWEKTGYAEFFESVKDVYDPIVRRVVEFLSEYPFVDIIESEFGQSQNSYNYILSSLMKGNFGICFYNQDTEKSDLFSVFSTYDFSLSPAVLFHEYSHPFINPLTDKNYDIAQKYIDSYEELKHYNFPQFTEITHDNILSFTHSTDFFNPATVFVSSITLQLCFSAMPKYFCKSSSPSPRERWLFLPSASCMCIWHSLLTWFIIIGSSLLPMPWLCPISKVRANTGLSSNRSSAFF